MTLSAQFIIQDRGLETAAESLRRRPVWIPTRLPARVGDAHCDYALPNADGELFQLLAAPADQLLLQPTAGAEILLNDLPCAATGEILRSGDRISYGDLQMHFYTMPKKVRSSFSSLLLARLAKILILFFLCLQAWFFLFLPLQVQNPRLWERAMDRQQISNVLDQLRADIKGFDVSDSNQETLQQALLAELDDRAYYIRQYEDRLTRGQRRSMLADLRRIRHFSDHLLRDGQTFPLPPLELDRAVNKLTSAPP